MTLNVVDLFCGAGGSSLGARAAHRDISIVGAVDAWGLAASTFKANFPGADVYNGVLTPRSKPSETLSRQRVDLLLASPECTNHSVAKGNRPRDEESLRSAQFVLGYVRALEPRWIVIENVIQMRRWDGFSQFTKSLERLGYHLQMQVLDAADFGVPQTRRRLFILADRQQAPDAIEPPKRERAAASSVVRVDGPWASRPLYREGRAAGTIERAERAFAAIGKGKPFLIVYYGSDGAGGWQPLDRPIRTLTTLDRFGLVTWDGRTPMLRMLQVDELKRAMGFPANFKFPEGSRREQIMMLGNAVCPPVMRAVVRSLCADQLDMRSAA